MRPWSPWLSRLSTSVLSKVAANCSNSTPLGGRGRRVAAMRAPPPAPSGRGTGARARSPGGSCDQRVIARERADLDERFRGTAPLAELVLERAGVLERGDCPMPRKRSRVPAGQLAGVERSRQDRAVADAGLDAAADQARVKAVVVGVEAQVAVPAKASISGAFSLSRWRTGPSARQRVPVRRSRARAQPHGDRWRRGLAES
jgi:hypothetical protein